ncbi:hypothetical protein A2U01_0110636, partial [Trifolium medium]|nr:hypothetical protein [Trifolium medium]
MPSLPKTARHLPISSATHLSKPKTPLPK